ncbi:MAG: peptide ABC transporter substrate-binding protein [Phycisphaerae bacterium]
MLRTLLIPALLLLLLGVVCFSLTATQRGPATITVASADDIKTLDPGAMSWAVDIRAATGLWEGLTTNDPITLEPRPGVASSWEISPDTLTYTFHLRPNARWSNGDPVTAFDFAFAWQRNLRPVTAAQYLNMLLHIQGAQAYYDALEAAAKPTAGVPAGRRADEGVGTTLPAPPAQVSGIVVVDPHTLVVHLAGPCTYFLDLLAFPPYFPLHEASMRPFLIDHNPALGYAPQWIRPPNLVSNGPFQLTDWQFKRYLQFEPNPYYWDRSAVQCPRLRLVSYAGDARAALLAYQTGVVDVLSWVPQQFAPELLAQVRAGQRRDVQFQPVFGSYYYEFNCLKKPFNDPRIRKALALAIDKRQLTERVLRMGQRPLNVLVPPESIPGYASPAGLEMDVPAARRLLKEAGYPDGAGLEPVEILYTNTDLIHDRIAQAIGQMWQENLHIAVTYRGLERATFGADRKSQHFGIARGGWYGDYPDPMTWLNLLRTNDGDNDGKYSNPRFDALLDQADAEALPAKRLALMVAAERILVEEDFPFIPLYQYADGFVYDPAQIAGMDLNVRMLVQFKYLRRR